MNTDNWIDPAPYVGTDGTRSTDGGPGAVYRPRDRAEYCRVTEQSYTPATPRPLNDVMEFDHIVKVDEDGTISDSPMSVGTTDAYFDLNVATDGTDEFIMTDGWELLRGFTGQYSYNGPVMHSSEFIGGGLERHIRETPGYYVVLEVSGRCDYDGTTACNEDDGCNCEPAGWAVAFKPLPEIEGTP